MKIIAFGWQFCGVHLQVNSLLPREFTVNSCMWEVRVSAEVIGHQGDHSQSAMIKRTDLFVLNFLALVILQISRKDFKMNHNSTKSFE
jgi:hypothetical protein